jgi:hypothetical protein
MAMPMHSLVLDNQAISKLKSTPSPTEIRDADGELIGRFVPIVREDDIDQFDCPTTPKLNVERQVLAGARYATF